MYVPDNMTEEEVVAIITKISKRLAQKFTFGYYDRDDIAQEAFIIGMQGLEKYDSTRPLENFLWVHIRNRLKNYKRNEYERLDSPCVNCTYSDGDICDEHDDIMSCKSYRNWFYRNQSKKNLMNPIGLSNVDDVQEQYMRTCEIADDIASHSELKQMIDDNLPTELRADYLRMLTSIYVPKNKRERVQQAVRDILEKYNYDI